MNILSLPSVVLLCLFSYTQASPAFGSAPAFTRRDAAPESHACGQIVNSGNQVFEATLVYECLQSVPFNAAVATKFIDYYNTSVQFQSTLAYLKNPPASYQQPAVDFVGELNLIQNKITTGVFQNQYDFEAALQTLIYSTHDAHVNLISGILGVFSFGTQFSIASVSKDGSSIPKVYLSDDLLQLGDDASEIVTINGVDVIEYLQEFAAKNAVGCLEAHCDFNTLMSSPAQDIQAVFSIWGGGATFYPGDTLTLVLQNTTVIGPTPWLAVYNSIGNTGPLETGGDFYNFFVLGWYPASYDPTSPAPDSSPTAAVTQDVITASATSAPTTTSSTAEPTVSSWGADYGYPDPDIFQDDLGTFGGGWVSGYFLEDSSISVLSIPSFQASGSSVNEFSSTVTRFLNASKEAGMKKVVIDLQQNSGGIALLAFDTFKQFFPTIVPYGGSRLRAHDAANVMGDSITSYFDSLDEDDSDYYSLVADEWVSSTRINADTGRNFSSWAEFYGPHPYNSDTFTTTQQYNMSSYIFDMESVQDFDEYFAVYGYDGNLANTTQPYLTEDIIILSDSLCSSTCALFMEMMHHEAGVRTVVAGGLPHFGPMQTPSMARGARAYGIVDTLDANIGYSQYLLQFFDDPRQTFLPNRTEALDVYVEYADLNLRDQIRKESDIPVQFAYEAATCRIFYTPTTFYNMSNLWQYAADAIWTNSSLCVTNSTGYASTNGTNTVGPPSTIIPNIHVIKPSDPQLGNIIINMLNSPSVDGAGIDKSHVKKTRSDTSFEGTPCPDDECDSYGDYICLTDYPTCDPTTGKPTTIAACVGRCYVNPGTCSNGGFCQPLHPEATKLDTKQELKVARGYCDPIPGTCSTGSKVVKPGKPAPPSKGLSRKRS